jgi:amino acid adenylation domain-containing protein
MDDWIIHSIFEDAKRRFPKNTAIKTDSREITYSELNACTNRVAHALINLGVDRQSIVGIYFQASVEYVVALLGVLKSGAIFMPLDTHNPAKRLGKILAKTNPIVIITGKHLEVELSKKLHKTELSRELSHLIVFKDSLDFNIRPFPEVDSAVAEGLDFPASNPSIVSNPEDGCYLITTSGSTGKPKIILGMHKGLSHFIKWEIEEFNLNENERVCQLSPVTFDVSLRDIFVPLSIGGTLYIPDENTRIDPGKLVRWLKESGISHVHIIPTIFRLITQEIESLNQRESAFPTIKHMLIAGEVLYGNDIDRWRKTVGTDVKLVNIYGPSETTLAKLFYRIEDKHIEPYESVPLGIPIADTEVLIVKNNKKCMIGEIGEIYIKTDFMSKGYYKAPELNVLAFIQNPLEKKKKDIVYKTGDLGKYLPDGRVQFAGRLDGQIKLHGIRIEITEIETVLGQHPQVRQAAVIDKNDVYGNIKLIGYIVPKPGKKPTIESLRRFVEDMLPEYMLPAMYVTLESLPLTQNGKIDRYSLPDPPRIRPEMEEIYIPPTTKLEKALCKIWTQLLNIDRIGKNDNLFYLGGTSLLTVRAVELVKKELGIDLPVTKIFQYPQISALVADISKDHHSDSFHEKIQKRAHRRMNSLSRRKRTRLINNISK